MTSGATASLGGFASRTRFAHLPHELVALTNAAFTDHVASRLAGSHAAVTAIALASLGTSAIGESARGLAKLTAVDARDTAWISAIAAHALEFDDVGLLGHPSAVLASAVLAEAEALRVDGARAVTAYAVGLEVWTRLVGMGAERYHVRGWHTTSIVGALAAAAAVANLHALDQNRATAAIALASSMAAGTRSNFGTMGKPIQVGAAARTGIVAARLAHAGATACVDALESPQGLIRALSGDDHRDLSGTVVGLGGEWHALAKGLNFRKFPMCYGAERAIEAALELIVSADVHPRDVRRVVVSTGRNQMQMLRFATPMTANESRFSFPFAMAAALIRRKVSPKETDDTFVVSPAVRETMAKVVVEGHDEVDAGDSRFGAYDEVTIHMLDGNVRRSRQVRHARGHYLNPLSLDERWQKFEACARIADLSSDAHVLFERLNRAADQPAEGMDIVHKVGDVSCE